MSATLTKPPISLIKEIKTTLEQPSVLLAKSLAQTAHRNQRYEPECISYYFHLDKVAQNVLLAYDGYFDLERAITLSYLHDTVEDTELSIDDIAVYFSEDIVTGVNALTKNKSLSKQAQIEDSISRILSKTPEVGIVKMADRVTNLSNSLISYTKAKKAYYAAESDFILTSLGHIHTRMSRLLKGQIELFKFLHT